ncbi:3314_t:CDS:1, partial [Ambispora leptoticha]
MQILFWRALVSCISIIIVFIFLVFFIKVQILQITSVEFLNDSPTHIPPADTIIPNLQKAAGAESSYNNNNDTSIDPTQSTSNSTSQGNSNIASVPGTSGVAINSQRNLSAEQCVAYAKYCRDVICAFQDFRAGCNNDGS